MIQHQVNHYAGDRNIQPHRQGQACNSLVPLKIASHGPARGNNDERNNHAGKHRVRRQNRKINRPRNSLPRESRYSVMRVIHDVRNQKQHRGGQRRDLAIAMGMHPLLSNEVIAA